MPSGGGFRETRETPFMISAAGLAISTDDPLQKATEEAAAAEASTTLKRAPAMRICHLCGTPQLLKSFKCHVQRCAQAWLTDEGAKPKASRRPLPEGPTPPEGKPLRGKVLEDFNR